MLEKKNIKRLKVSLFFIIICLVIYVFWNQFPPIIKEIKTTNISTLIILAIMGLLYQFFDGLSLRAIAKDLGAKDVTIIGGWFCSLYSAFYRVITFGSATYISIIYYFKRHGIDTSKGFSISTLNYMAQKIAVVVTAVILYILNFSFMEEYYHKYQSYLLLGIIVTSLIVIVLILICVSEKFHNLVLMIFKLDKKKKFNNIKNKTEDSLTLIRNSTKTLLYNKKLIIKIILLNILKFCCWYILPYIIFSRDFSYSILDYISITALGIALIGVIPAPGAMGSTEFIFGLLFARLMDVNKAMSGVFLYRFANFIIPTVCGGLIAIYMRIKEKAIKN